MSLSPAQWWTRWMATMERTQCVTWLALWTVTWLGAAVNFLRQIFFSIGCHDRSVTRGLWLSIFSLCSSIPFERQFSFLKWPPGGVSSGWITGRPIRLIMDFVLIKRLVTWLGCHCGAECSFRSIVLVTNPRGSLRDVWLFNDWVTDLFSQFVWTWVGRGRQVDSGRFGGRQWLGASFQIDGTSLTEISWNLIHFNGRKLEIIREKIEFKLNKLLKNLGYSVNYWKN